MNDERILERSFVRDELRFIVTDLARPDSLLQRHCLRRFIDLIQGVRGGHGILGILRRARAKLSNGDPEGTISLLNQAILRLTSANK